MAALHLVIKTVDNLEDTVRGSARERSSITVLGVIWTHFSYAIIHLDKLTPSSADLLQGIFIIEKPSADISIWYLLHAITSAISTGILNTHRYVHEHLASAHLICHYQYILYFHVSVLDIIKYYN